MSEKVQAPIEEIKGLTVLELAEAVGAMEEEFGVSAAAPVAVAGAAPAAGRAADGTGKKTDFDVVITGPGQKKVKVIKVVRDIAGLGLKEAEALVDGVPKAIKRGVPQAEADEVRAKLEKVGATVEVK